MPEPLVLLLLVAASTLAGFVDAIAGGGGLILFPALVLGLPADTPIPTILGTNKVAAVSGTSAAALQFVRARIVTWQDLVWPVALAMVGAAIGARVAYLIDPAILRPVMVGLLAAMLAFTLLKPALGQHHAPRYAPLPTRAVATGIALVVGFYDGFFGPGTGSLLIFLYVGVLGLDFLHASALAKAANWGSNIAAMTLFVWNGSWIPLLALFLALGNVVGGQLGARLALGKGSAWVRWVFVTVVSALLLRLAWQVATGA